MWRHCQQMLISYRAITCTEYDEAARRTPHRCPLVQAGDWRTGQQLMLDAAADSVVGIAELAASPGGRAKLDTLAASVEAWAGDAERRAPAAAAAPAGPCDPLGHPDL